MGYRFAIFRSPSGKLSVVDLWRKRLSDLRARVAGWASFVSDRFPGAKRCMITLTYDTDGTLTDASDWSPNHIKVFLNALKRRAGLELYSYAWVAELQERGVPHYHVVCLYKGRMPFPDKSGMWFYGMSNIKFKVRTPFYLLTYLGKEYQKNFSLLPKGARAYGVGFSDSSDRLAYRVACLPEVVRGVALSDGLAVAKELLRKPSWMKSEHVGSAMSREYAEFLASDP